MHFDAHKLNVDCVNQKIRKPGKNKNGWFNVPAKTRSSRRTAVHFVQLAVRDQPQILDVTLGEL